MRWTAFNTALFFDRLTRIVPFWLYACGAVLLLAKILRPEGIRPLAAVIVAVALLCVCIVADLFRQGGAWYDASYAMAWLDLRNRAGGRIMAGDEAALEQARTMPAVTMKPFLRSLLMPLVFLAAVYFAPMPAGARAASGVGVERAVAAMARRVEEAEKNEAVPKPDAEALRARLHQLEGLSKRDPAAAAEALAALSGRLEDAAAGRLDRSDAALEKIHDAMKAAELAERGAGDEAGFESAADEAMSAVGEIVRAEGGAEYLSPELREALENAVSKAGLEGREGQDGRSGGGIEASAGSLSSADLRQLSAALEKAAGQQAEAAMMCGLADSAGSQSGQAGGSGENGLPSLSQSMAAHQAAMAGATDISGRGGIGKGGGATPMSFGDETDEAGARFDRAELPKGQGVTPGETVERRRIRPEEPMPPEEFRPVRPGGHAVPGRVWAGQSAATLSPERSRAAEEYFRRLAEQER